MLLYQTLNNKSRLYSTQRTTNLVLLGTLVVVFLICLLLVLHYGIGHPAWVTERGWLLVGIFGYLFSAKILLKRNHQQIVNWMIVAFYLLLSFFTLLFGGLNAPVGILTVTFALILPSILMGAHTILPVTLLTMVVLGCVQYIHEMRILTPSLENLSLPSTYWDVLSYSTIFAIFALVSWLASSQREKNLLRALRAESALKKQKVALSMELEKESATLRLTQLNQIRQLHRFALLGQSAAATLHELSNHLSILNFDINDLHQQNSNSKIISSAKDSIEHINKMVHRTRRQLNSYDELETFDAIALVKQTVKDLTDKFRYSHIRLVKPTIKGRRTFITHSSRLALMQIITILLNNAFDACSDILDSEVRVKIENKGAKLKVHIIDTGIGIEPEIAKILFNPVTSGKPTGLGVGLYIAQHLANDQLSGSIELMPSKIGAHFVVSLPSLTKASIE